MVTRSALILAALFLGCSWELPAPRIATPDVPAPPPPPPPPPPPDVLRMDVRTEASVDVLQDIVDVRDATDVVDVPRDFLETGVCGLGETRSCYSGSASTLGVGYCRAGVNTCDRGAWQTRCDNEVTRDCTDRVCGSDGCEGSCGRCPDGQVCNDSGRCVTVTTCGPMNFVVSCGAGNCPMRSVCVDGGCVCPPNTQAQLCNGDVCPRTGCTGTDWWCAPAPFCASGTIVCPGNFLCPRWSVCDTVNRACSCRPGFTARRCDGVVCTLCPGTEYECVPNR
jgi:hypothetical protein